MSDQERGGEQVGFGEAQLGEAQAENPPADPEYLEDEQERGGEEEPDS